MKISEFIALEKYLQNKYENMSEEELEMERRDILEYATNTYLNLEQRMIVDIRKLAISEEYRLRELTKDTFINA